MGEIRHVVVKHATDLWCSTPANNGANGPVWQWGDELLVGMTVGHALVTDKGHQTDHDRGFDSWLARSEDGGETWQCWRPEHYAGEGVVPRPLADQPDGWCPTGPDATLRIEGSAYHGNGASGRGDATPRWYGSDDRGASWRGPFTFAGLADHEELAGLEVTSRTDYLLDDDQITLFGSARRPSDQPNINVLIDEKPFVARSTDGGATFGWVGWMVPWSDTSRAVMPATVALGGDELVTTLRRKSPTGNWIDCYRSSDAGAIWRHAAEVTRTEEANQFNGNPPALVALAGGRLCCAYGNRSMRAICARYSDDAGASWSEPQIVRDDFHSGNGWPDLGYARLFQRSDGQLVVTYFWCTEAHPETHIAASIFAAVAP